jgi:hypothetical protein
VLRKKITLPQPQGVARAAERGSTWAWGTGVRDLAGAGESIKGQLPLVAVGPLGGTRLRIVVDVVAYDRRGCRQDRLLGAGDLASSTRSYQDVREDETPAIELLCKGIIKRFAQSFLVYIKNFYFFHFKGRNVVAFDHKFDPTHWQFGGPREYWPNARRASIRKVSARRSSPEYASWPMHV